MKKFLFGLGLVAAVSSAQASYLYWQLDGSEAEGREFTHAIVWAQAGSESSATELMNNVNLGGDLYEVGTIAQNWDAGAYVVDVSSYSSGNYSFYIELKNYDSATSVYKTIGYLSGSSYANLVANNYIDTGLSIRPAAVWHGGSYSPTPEPTSALLILFGLAGLALKRRAI